MQPTAITTTFMVCRASGYSLAYSLQGDGLSLALGLSFKYIIGSQGTLKCMWVPRVLTIFSLYFNNLFIQLIQLPQNYVKWEYHYTWLSFTYFYASLFVKWLHISSYNSMEFMHPTDLSESLDGGFTCMEILLRGPWLCPHRCRHIGIPLSMRSTVPI